MPDALTITREWFELLEGLPTVQSRWNVLYAAAGFAFDGREPEGLNMFEKSIFMTIRGKLKRQRRNARFYTNHKNEASYSDAGLRRKKRLIKTVKSSYSDGELFTSNQHIDTSNIPLTNLDKSKLPSPTAKNRFIPPTLEEVKSYCSSRRNAVDAEQFYAYYSANGWMVGHGNKMRDWKKAVQYWERSQYQRQNQRRPKRDYSGI